MISSDISWSHDYSRSGAPGSQGNSADKVGLSSRSVPDPYSLEARERIMNLNSTGVILDTKHAAIMQVRRGALGSRPGGNGVN